MLDADHDLSLIRSPDVRSFFHDTVDSTVRKQGVDATPGAVDYIADLLAHFSRTERLYEKTEEGLQPPVLAFIYGRAVHAGDCCERTECMRRLGDVALFLSGMFSESFERKLVDVDYCIAMGEGAYAWLSDAPLVAPIAREDRRVFAELAGNFARLVDVLNEIGEEGRSDRDVLRLYELWLKTGSPRAAARLRAQGVEVIAQSVTRAWH